MSEPRFMPAPARASVGADVCPCVAELIGYALGQVSHEDRQRIDAHLQKENCDHCRGWIEQAARYRTEPRPVPLGKEAGLHATFALPPALPPVSSDQTPVPPSARWQQQAFRDLEKRLRALEDG